MSLAMSRQMMLELLPPDESVELARHEAVIEAGLQTFVEVGSALLAIRDKRLHRATHHTFEDYCRERWSLTRSRAYRLMDAAQVVGNLSPIGDTPGEVEESNQLVTFPQNEAQARPLASLEPDQQRAAWSEAVETAPNGKPTAKHVEEVARRYRDEPEPDAEPESDAALPSPGTWDYQEEPEDEPEERQTLGRLPAAMPSPANESERIRKRFQEVLGKCLDHFDRFTCAVSAKPEHSGYGGFKSLAAGMTSTERRRLKGEIEILRDRLEGWLRHL